MHIRPLFVSSHNNSSSSLVPSSLINCINITIAGASTTPYPSACIAQFEGLALLVVCLSKLHVISFAIKITYKRSYLCLASLDAWITSGRSFFNPFLKLPSAQFCPNVVCLHVDVYFLPSSLLPSLVWLEFSTSCIPQKDLSSPIFIR
jgi:hypothetical protein